MKEMTNQKYIIFTSVSCGFVAHEMCDVTLAVISVKILSISKKCLCYVS